MSASGDDVLKLVGMAYDAALDERKWPTFLEAIASSVSGSSAILRSNDIQKPVASFNASVGYDPAWQAAYCNHFVKGDYYNKMMNQFAPGQVFSSGLHIDQRELRKTEYFNDYLLPQDKLNSIGVFLLKDERQSLVVGIQRGKRGGAFGEEEAQLISALVPHVTRAVQVHRKIHSVTADKEHAQGALDQLRMGVILVNHVGTPLYLNRAAELLMTQEVGLGIFHNRLALHSPAETTKLHCLIANAAQSNDRPAVGGDMRISMPFSMDFVLCMVTPLSSEMSCSLNMNLGSDCVALFLTRSAGLRLSPKRLVSLYKITPAEARLATHLAALKSLEEAADDLGISIHTARTQLKSTFSKTGTRSQAELMMLLASGTLAQCHDE